MRSLQYDMISNNHLTVPFKLSEYFTGLSYLKCVKLIEFIKRYK